MRNIHVVSNLTLHYKNCQKNKQNPVRDRFRRCGFKNLF